MKNLFIIILSIVLMIIAYKVFVKIKNNNYDANASSRVTSKRHSNSSSTTSADQNPVRRTRIGKKLDNIYNKHEKYTNEALN